MNKHNQSHDRAKLSTESIANVLPTDRIKLAVGRLAQFCQGVGLVRVARAPGRLDVMGGIADYTGSRVCQMPLRLDAAAAVRKRDDAKVVCMSQQTPGEVVLQADDLLNLDARALREKIGSVHAWAGYTSGCVAWLMQHEHRPSMASGVTLLIDSDVPPGGGVSSSAAIEVATMTALCSLYGITLTPMKLAAACQNVENQVVGAPCGVMDQVVSNMGKHDALLEILCQSDSEGMPAQVQGTWDIPRGYSFIGIHSGVRHDVSGDPYGDTRVAAFMARKIIRDNSSAHAALDHLANLSLDDYENNLRQHLPLTIIGSAFIEKHQTTDDAATSIDPKRSYHVRDAADHHVREMHRVTRFIELIKDNSQLSQAVQEQAIIDAGDLMIQSHESYGRCARLGHELTDLLANMLRAAGREQGIFGCRITGGGCGGTVAVLLRDTAESYQTIEAIRKCYEAESDRKTMLFTGTSDGGNHSPVITLSLESNQKASS